VSDSPVTVRVALNILRYSGGATDGSCAAGGDAFADAACSGAVILVGSTTVVGMTTGSALSIRHSSDTGMRGDEAALYVNCTLMTAPPLSDTGSYMNCVTGSGGDAGGEAGGISTGFFGKPKVAGVPSSIDSVKLPPAAPNAPIWTTKR